MTCGWHAYGECDVPNFRWTEAGRWAKVAEQTHKIVSTIGTTTEAGVKSHLKEEEKQEGNEKGTTKQPANPPEQVQ